MSARVLLSVCALLLTSACSQPGDTNASPSSNAQTLKSTKSTNPPLSANVSFAGTWKLDITDDLKEAAKKLKQPPPEVILEAHEDGTFDLWGRTANGEFEVSGEYFVHEDKVTLRAKEVNGKPPLLNSEDEPRAGTVSEDNQTFTDDSGSVWRRSQN